jgi:hypothetical protein
VTAGRLRELARENHRLHGVPDQSADDSYDYLIADRGEIEELAGALACWMRTGDPAPVVAEVADCVIILDHILDQVTGGAVSMVEAVAAKVAADRVKLLGHVRDPAWDVTA